MGNGREQTGFAAERVAAVTGAGEAHRGLDAFSTAIGLASVAITEAPMAIYTVDLLGNITSWNRAAETLFGWSADEVLGHPIPFLPPDEFERSLTGLDHLMSGQVLSNVTFSPVRKDGTRLDVLTTASVLIDDDGQPASVLVYALDITEREQARRILADAGYKWKRLLENISDTITLVAADGTIIESTGQFVDVLGYDTDWWSGTYVLDIIHPDDRPAAAAMHQQVLDNPGREYKVVFRTRHQDGHYELIEYTLVNLLDDPGVAGIVISSGNVTDVKKAEMLLQDEAVILELVARDASLDETLPAIVSMVEHHSDAHAALYLLDASGSHLVVGASGSLPPDVVKGFERVRLDPTTGIGAAVFGRQPIIVPDFAADEFTSADAEALAAHGLLGGWAVPIIDSRSGEVLGCITTLFADRRGPTAHEQDVGAVASHLASIAIDRDRFQRQLYHQARHSQLTGLPNRHSIKEHLEEALTRARAADAKTGVMFIDLDRFKVVNDSFGHGSGDKLLVRFAGRLQNLVRQGDYVGHFAADEFVVVLDRIAGFDDVQFVADRIEAALDEPFALEEGEVFLSVSMGVAISDAISTAESLLHQADAAMFRAKQLGGDRLAVFDDAMQERAVEQLRVDRDLRVAIEQGDLELHYQPEIDLRTGRIIGAEALMRWQHAERGLVFPKDFITVAEDTGLIVRIGRWVLEESVRQAAEWRSRPGLEDFWISVNLSARQLTWRDLVPVVAAALEQHDLPAGALMLEITESVLIEDAEAGLLVLEHLKELGVRLAIDDFGTGYSSLSYLHRFPVDMVKIDRSFVTPLDQPGGSPVAAAVMQMSNALGLQTCAEGVETDSQLGALRDMGCDIAQGFLFSTAVPPPAFEALVDGTPEW